jgi:hypothetical protein
VETADHDDFARAATVAAAHRRVGVWALGKTRREAVEDRRGVRRCSTTSVSIRGRRRARREGTARPERGACVPAGPVF